MKSLLESLLISLSMYSTIPVKCLNWNEKNLRNAMIFFPLIGIICGFGVWLLWSICTALTKGAFLFSVLSVFSVVLVTGGIHLDGFCDTADALYSRRPVEDKLRILKDSHCGAFAVFSVILVIALNLGAYSEIYNICERSITGLLTGGFILSRCLSGISVTRFSYAPTSSLAKTFGENAGKYVSIILILEFLLTSSILIICYKSLAVIQILTALLVFVYYYRMQKKEFGGLTGDLAGFFVVVCETVWLLETAILGGIF